ncbi:MAG: DUF1667 domain-containing protein [Candidatus Ornithospirochaeta sp.]
MKNIDLTCIGCPMGCLLSVDVEDGRAISVRGNSCLNGKKYAESEVSAPKRVFTSSIPITGGDWDMVSVKTSAPVPKESILDLAYQIRSISLSAPIHIGQVLVSNVAGLGVDLVATREIRKKQ